MPGDSMSVRLALAVCLLLYFGLRFWNLPYQPVNTLFDEGVHLALMQMLAREEGALYRDFLFIHPPGVILVGAWLWKRVEGNLFLLRCLYILFCALALPPFYALVKRYYGVRAVFGTLLLLAVTPGFSTWLGRTIFLELPLNVVLCAAFWLLLCAPPA
jgi:dolichyl-phosphate-mannose--protein O-mannosyl transferase